MKRAIAISVYAPPPLPPTSPNFPAFGPEQL